MDVKKIIGLFFTVLFLASCNENDNAAGSGQFVKSQDPSCAGQQIKNEYLVVWKDGHTSVEKFKSEEDYIENFLEKNREDIKTSEPHYRIYVEPSMSIGDPGWGGDLNWGVGAIDAESVWEDSKGRDEIIVAVIDSGLDVSHPEIVNALAINPDEVFNGVDDDGNGLVDDVNGYDFVSFSGDVIDYTGHGTHVAGVIAAQHEVGSVLGVAPSVKILPLSFISAGGGGSINGAISAIRYATDRGSRVINASWGGDTCSLVLKAEIENLADENVLFVAAAGNSFSNISIYPEYPAAFTIENMITVGASTADQLTADFSNHGELVDLVAPGANIISLYPPGLDVDDKFGVDGDGLRALKGTSMATPFVAGAAALLWSHRPDASYAQVKQALLEGVDEGPYPVNTRGQLNLRRSLELFLNL